MNDAPFVHQVQARGDRDAQPYNGIAGQGFACGAQERKARVQGPATKLVHDDERPHSFIDANVMHIDQEGQFAAKRP